MNTNTLAEQIQQQARIPALVASELADYALSGGYTSGCLHIGVGELGYETWLYAVIFPVTDTRWDIAAGYVDSYGKFKLYHACSAREAQTHRWHMHFAHKAEYFTTFTPTMPPAPPPAADIIPEGEFIYVLKFDKPIGSDKHAALFYGGWTRDFPARMECHSKGRGSHLTRWAVRHGIGWQVVYKAPGTTADEKRMKRSFKSYRDFLASVGVIVPGQAVSA